MKSRFGLIALMFVAYYSQAQQAKNISFQQKTYSLQVDTIPRKPTYLLSLIGSNKDNKQDTVVSTTPISPDFEYDAFKLQILSLLTELSGIQNPLKADTLLGDRIIYAYNECKELVLLQQLKCPDPCPPACTKSKDGIPFIQGASFVTENDVFFPVDNWDQNYTGQFKLEFYLKGILDKGLWLAEKKLNDNAVSSFRNVSLFVNGMGYTPSRRYFHDTGLVKTERPFASYICFGMQRTSGWVVKDENWKGFSMTFEYTAGKIGSPLAGKVQNFLHEYLIVGSYPVNGWHHQVGYPGRFACYGRTYGTYNFLKIDDIRTGSSNPDYWRLGIRYDVIGGYFMDYIKTGLVISNRNIALGANTAADIAALNVTPMEKKVWVNTELWISARYVFFNSMLQGHKTEGYVSNANQTLSEYTIADTMINRVVFDPSFRLKIYVKNSKDDRMFVFVYGINYRTKEFMGGDRQHFYGTIGIQTFKLH